MTPNADDLWFLPLGGCGEIGMNLNLYGHNGRWLMVDCGITFANPGEYGPHIQMADPQFIVERKDNLTALLVTHAHEDHVGAVAHLWRWLQCPVYCTAFTAAILRRKLAEAGLLGKVPIEVVGPGERMTLDVFDVEWIDQTHSTPESQALLIRTPAGNVFHTGDWKLDPEPVVGAGFDAERLAAVADDEVLAMVCDSTNALESGRSNSEGELFENLLELVEQAPARVIVGCFGSNVARLTTLARVAQRSGRYAGLLGRSLHNYHRAAMEAGVWDPGLIFVDPAHLGYLPRDEVLAIATGSQGEPRTALRRLASGTHPDLDLERDDTLLMSSRVIPGNEEAVAALIRRLGQMGVRVICDEELNKPIHASGHPAQEELADMYRWVKPRVAIPVHGEAAHMQANAELARAIGVPAQMLGANGDLFMLAPQRGVRRGAAHAGRLGLEHNSLIKLASD
jgi:ribonuclease J